MWDRVLNESLKNLDCIYKPNQYSIEGDMRASNTWEGQKLKAFYVFLVFEVENWRLSMYFSYLRKRFSIEGDLLTSKNVDSLEALLKKVCEQDV